MLAIFARRYLGYIQGQRHKHKIKYESMYLSIRETWVKMKEKYKSGSLAVTFSQRLIPAAVYFGFQIFCSIRFN